MKKIIKQIVILVCLVALLVLPYFVFAKDTEPLKILQNLGNKSGYSPEQQKPTSLAATVGTIVNAFLGLLGIIFIILIIYAGYNWMTASGNEQKLEKAKETIWRAIIGLIIVIAAYSIWVFIDKFLIG